MDGSFALSAVEMDKMAVPFQKDHRAIFVGLQSWAGNLSLAPFLMESFHLFKVETFTWPPRSPPREPPSEALIDPNSTPRYVPRARLALAVLDVDLGIFA